MAPTPCRADSARRNAFVVLAAFAMGAAPITAHHYWLSRSPALATQAAAHAEHSAVDIGFAQDMSLHHEQALVMARMALVQGSPKVQLLAQGIVNQQLKEIGYMQGWLMLWQAPSLADADDMMWMRKAYARSPQRDPLFDQYIESCIQSQGMPGLARPVELEALEASSTPDNFDSTFLALMVRHHQSAIVMARFASQHAALALVRDFAAAVAAEQQRDVVLMLRMLRSG